MSDVNDKPEDPKANFDFEMPSLDDIRDQARKAQESLQNPPTITDKQKAIAITLLGTYILFRIEKRMVNKVVRKQLVRAFSELPVKIDLQSYLADLEAHEVAQRAKWLAKHPY